MSTDIDQQINQHNEKTAKAACLKGQLQDLARKMSRSTLERKLFEDLMKIKVGTWEVEMNAVKALLRSRNETWGGNDERIKGKNKLNLIRKHRDPEKVADQIKLKIKYCQEEEEKWKK